jgi:hypothetical protein
MRVNRTLTIAAGTPFNLGTGKSTAVPLATPPLWVSRVFIQMLVGGTGYGIIYDGVAYGRLPNAAGTQYPDVTAHLAAAQGSNPGGAYGNGDQFRDEVSIDANTVWVDGSHTGDLVAAGFDPKV